MKPFVIALCAVVLAASVPHVHALASPSVPVYPGAVKETPTPGLKSSKMCGRTMTIVSYHASADPKTIAAWYKGHVAVGAFLDMSSSDSGTHQSMFDVLTPDGSTSIVVLRLDVAGANMSAAAKTLGMDKTQIGIESYDPPLGANYVALVARAARGDAASRAEATKQIKVLCPSD